MPPRKKVAAVVTVYHRWSHADVIVSKLLEGYLHDGKEMPSLELASLYRDQKHKEDMAPGLAAKHRFRLSKSIADALTLGGKSLAVDGVLLIGEHGKYPVNERGQILYPRRRFLEETAKVFEASGKGVPVFSDKHLAAEWADAKWMYDKARALMVPFMAGSSVPVTFRKPELKLPLGCVVEGCVQVGYGPMEGYGFHALEGMQCMLERRKGGETGVKAVQAFKGKAMWDAFAKVPHGEKLLAPLVKMVKAHAPGDMRGICAKDKEAAIIVIDYADGLKAALCMLNGWVYEFDGTAFLFAGKLAGKDAPQACQFYLQQPDPFYHFAQLLRGIEGMVNTGHPPYPVERTLLTTGILDAAMTSLAEKGRRIDTPHLAIKYEARDHAFATGPIPKGIKR
ncbi:MAG: hypothetical protein K2W96_24600 [Gemmataceae bacterium]|nr:hypothetical protein [Gemmataceae bacterium]